MINAFRNFVVASILALLLLLLSIYLGALAFMVLQNNAYPLTLDNFLSWYAINLWYSYCLWFWQNYSAIPWDYNNYALLHFLFATLSPFSLILLIVVKKRAWLYEKRPFKEAESIHGDAHWAEESDVRKAGLRASNGILLGTYNEDYLVADGYQHALLFAPTGSGKGVGFVIPNLLFWQGSAFINDIKLENYEYTSGWRQKMGQKVYCWNPADPDGITHCYNPIDWVSEKPGQMVDDVQKIGNLIIPKREFWENEARTLFVGIALYLISAPEKVKSFGEVVRTLRSDDVVYSIAVALDTMGSEMNPVGYMNLAAFLQKADKERSGVISTLNAHLELWANPLIDTATASSDFNILEFKKVLSTVYVGVTPDNLKRLQPLLQVFYQQATEFLCRKLPSKEEPYGVLFMMDEFPTLGKMEQFMSGIAFFRGYNVRLFLIVQDTEQLKGIYEESGMNSFLSNSTYRITFAANNVQTAELISKMVGNKTVDQVSANQPKFLDFNPASRSLNISKTQRALLLPQEVIGLPRDDQLLLIEACPPIRSKKIKYYADSFFKKRLLPPIVVPQQEPYDPIKMREMMADARSSVPESNEAEQPAGQDSQ